MVTNGNATPWNINGIENGDSVLGAEFTRAASGRRYRLALPLSS